MAAKKKTTKKTAVFNTQDQILALEAELDAIAGSVNELGKKAWDSNLSTRVQNTARKKYYEQIARQSEIEREIAQLKKTPKEVELEKKFQETRALVQKQFEKHLNAAEKELNKAVALSEKTGIPLESSLSETYNSYVPESFFKKWKPKFSENYIDEMLENGDLDLGEYYEGGEYGGWTKSFC